NRCRTQNCTIRRLCSERTETSTDCHCGPSGRRENYLLRSSPEGSISGTNSAIAHKRDEMVRARRSFAVEDWTVDLELLENARQAGYTTKVLFISTEDPNLNVGRVLLRMSQSGQGVPLGTIPESYDE